MSTKNKKQQSRQSSENPIIKERFTYNEKQLEIIKTGLSKECKCIYINGIWGTSKSYLAVLISLKLLYQNKINQIIYVRNPVESSSFGIGYIPGDIASKMLPFNQIFFDKLSELLSKSEIDRLTKENKLNCLPLGFARGLSITSASIIVDEAASLTYDDILLLLSRCGEHTKIFFIGDSINQNDIGSKSGFKKMFDLLSDSESKENGIFTFGMNEEKDIVRSGFVRFIMKKTGKIKF